MKDKLLLVLSLTFYLIGATSLLTELFNSVAASANPLTETSHPAQQADLGFDTYNMKVAR